MRPDPLPTRPFFRPEAEQFRRFRHLGSIALFRPLPLRLLALVPLVAVALAGAGAATLQIAPHADLQATAVVSGNALQLLLAPGNQRYFRPGDDIQLMQGTALQGTAHIEDTAPAACPPRPGAISKASCLRILARWNPHGAQAATPPTSVRGAPRRFLLP